MKKLITLIIVASLALTIQAQDITNALGTNGTFYLNDENDKEVVKFNDNGVFEFKNINSSNSTQIELYNAGHNLKLEFYKANGTPDSPTSVADGNTLGLLYFHGYTGSSYQLGAGISAYISGTPSGANIPTALSFSTTETTSLTTRMTIKPDGTVNIAGLYATTGGTSGHKPVYVDSSGDLVAGTAVAAPQVSNENQQLKEEIKTLKAEVAELREMVERLMEE